MKLVHLFKYYWPDNGGGIAAAMDMAIHAFQEYSKDRPYDGQEIICCWQESGKSAKKEMYRGIPVYRCKSLFEFASTKFSAQFMRVVDKRTGIHDIVIYNFPYPLVDLSILMKNVHGKLVVWWHCDFDTKKRRLLTTIYRPFVRHTLKKADMVVVSAKGNIKGSKTLRPFADKCHVIPFAVSDEMVSEGQKYFMEQQGKRHNDDKVHVLFIGRFVWYKGIDVLLRAFRRLDHEKYELTLVGNGPLLDKMKKLAKDLGMENVTFTGSVKEEEKIRQIKKSDFLVLPSISKAEAFAIVQIEVMAFGKPVINTWIPSGVPDVSIHGVSGITVQPGDAEELADAMKQLGEDAGLREKYGAEALGLVRKKYTMPVLVKRYEELFDLLST